MMWTKISSFSHQHLRFMIFGIMYLARMGILEKIEIRNAGLLHFSILLGAYDIHKCLGILIFS